MRLLSCVNQVVFLQVGQLSEVLVAGLTPEGTLSAVHSQMDLREMRDLKDEYLHLFFISNSRNHCGG